MKSLLLGLLLTVVIVFPAWTGGTQEEEAAGKVTLEVLNNEDLASPEGKVWEELKAIFLATYPNIQLVVETAYGEPYHQKAKARAAANDLPEVVYLWPGARSSYMYDNDLIQDLTPYIEKDSFKPAAMMAQGPNGEIFELPWTVTATSIFFTNTKILDELGMQEPASYEDLAAMVQPLKGAGYDPIIMGNADGWVMNSCLFSTLVGRYGGGDWMAEAGAGKHKFTDPAFVKALKMLESLYQDGVLPPSSIQTSFGDSPALFIQKKAPFMIDGNWRATTIKDTEEEFKSFIELRIFPRVPGEAYSNSSSIVPGVGFGMIKGLDKAKQEAALTMIKWFAGYEASKIRLARRGYVPVFKGDYEAPTEALMGRVFAFFEDYPAGSGVVDNFIGGTVNETLNDGMQEIALGLKTAEQVAQEVQNAWRESR